MWCNIIISLIMDCLAGAILLALFSRGCIRSILWARSANSFWCGRCRWWSVHHCHRLTFVGITWASTMFLPRSKNLAVFSLGKTRIFEPASAMYILIMEYYPDTDSYANLNINHWACLWRFGRVRLLITLQQNIGATARHRLFGDCAVSWTIGRYWLSTYVSPAKCCYTFQPYSTLHIPSFLRGVTLNSVVIWLKFKRILHAKNSLNPLRK